MNFQTKLGNGMGEQMLSREYYYLATQLPIDRFLTFYYGHPGFQINNILVILSVQVFIVTSTCVSFWIDSWFCILIGFVLLVVFLGTLNSSVSICKFNSQGQFIANQSGCYNLHPVFDWIKRCVYSIFLVFMIAFMPLFLQGM